MRVLIVEDEPLIADGVRRGLLNAGFAADIVTNAGAARSALQAENFDLAVVDIGLPREDGLQLLRSLRAGRQALPVMMLTARDHVSDRVAALDLGADDYVTKPFHVAELVARCRALIRRANAVTGPTIEFGRLRLETARKEAYDGGAAAGTHATRVVDPRMPGAQCRTHRGQGPAHERGERLERRSDTERHRGVRVAVARETRRRGAHPRGARPGIPHR